MIMRILTPNELLEYEVCSSRWAGWVSWKWLQELSSHYYARKVRRKHGRYAAFLATRPKAQYK